MNTSKRIWLSILGCLVLIGLVTSVKAGYYQDTLFPIGLTGLNQTGPYSEDYICPFGHEGWTWSAERNLINALGINCIGCQDAMPGYLADLEPENPSEYNYLHQICMLSNNPARPNPISKLDKASKRRIVSA